MVTIDKPMAHKSVFFKMSQYLKVIWSFLRSLGLRWLLRHSRGKTQPLAEGIHIALMHLLKSYMSFFSFYEESAGRKEVEQDLCDRVSCSTLHLGRFIYNFVVSGLGTVWEVSSPAP